MTPVNGEHDPVVDQKRVHANTQDAYSLILMGILWRRDRDSDVQTRLSQHNLLILRLARCATWQVLRIVGTY